MPPNHIKDIQIALNKTLLQTFSCHEPASQPLTLMADLGIPPLTHYRHLDLVRLHYRLTNLPDDSIPKKLYLSRAGRHQVMALPQIESQMRDSILTLYPTWKPGEPLPQPKHLHTVLEGNREKSFARSLQPVISQLWKEELLAQAQEPATTRVAAYLSIAGQDLHRPNLFKPAQYIQLHSKISTKSLLRIRTQHAKEIPTHQALTEGKKTAYVDRQCHLCHNHNNQSVTIGSESHFLLNSGCPHVPSSLTEQSSNLFSHLLQYLEVVPWEQVPPNTKISLLLGSYPPTSWKLTIKDSNYLMKATIQHSAHLAIQLSKFLRQYE